MSEEEKITLVNEKTYKLRIILVNSLFCLFISVMPFIYLIKSGFEIESQDSKIKTVYVVAIILSVIFTTIFLISKFKITNYLKMIDYDKYEICKFCKKVKPKDGECTNSHEKSGKNIFLPSYIVVLSLGIIMTIYFIFC